MIEALADYRQDLDSWVAPSSVDVVEIIGVGLPTLQEIQYRSVRQLDCGNDVCVSAPEKLIPFGRFDLYGDETVAAVSASAYLGDKRLFYLNLEEYEDSTRTLVDYSHANISEVEGIEILLAAILANRPTDEIDFIYENMPTFDEITYEILSTHSPVTLSVRDEDGNETSIDKTGTMIKTEIPGSRTFALASSTYVFIPEVVSYQAEVQGYAAGSYTLRVERLSNGNDLDLVSEFQAARVTPNMIATFTNTGEGISNISTDYDGDGVVDEVITPDGEIIIDTISYDEVVKEAFDFTAVSTGSSTIVQLPLDGITKDTVLEIDFDGDGVVDGVVTSQTDIVTPTTFPEIEDGPTEPLLTEVLSTTQTSGTRVRPPTPLTATAMVAGVTISADEQWYYKELQKILEDIAELLVLIEGQYEK